MHAPGVTYRVKKRGNNIIADKAILGDNVIPFPQMGAAPFVGTPTMQLAAVA